jgi:quercetin dioxygenase-like cupin family protein
VTSQPTSIETLPSRHPYAGVECWAFDSRKATVTRYRFAAGARFPIHRHAEEQVLLVDEGTIDVRVGGETSRMKAGDFLVIEPHAPHGVTAGPLGAQFLAVIVPRRDHRSPYTVDEEELQPG